MSVMFWAERQPLKKQLLTVLASNLIERFPLLPDGRAGGEVKREARCRGALTRRGEKSSEQPSGLSFNDNTATCVSLSERETQDRHFDPGRRRPVLMYILCNSPVFRSNGHTRDSGSA